MNKKSAGARCKVAGLVADADTKLVFPIILNAKLCCWGK